MDPWRRGSPAMPEARHGGEQFARVVGLRPREDVEHGCLPRRSGHARMTATRSAISATTPMSWVIRMMEVPNSRCSSRISSRICACTVTSSAVVGSSAISTSGRHASAMAIITRWRMPPESSCGYCFSAALGFGDAHGLQHLDGALGAPRRRDELGMRLDRLGQLRADRQHRVERGHRLLEDHGDLGRRACAASRARPSAARSVFQAGCSRRRCAATGCGSKRMIASAVIDLPGAGFAGDAQRLAARQASKTDRYDLDARRPRRAPQALSRRFEHRQIVDGRGPGSRPGPFAAVRASFEDACAGSRTTPPSSACRRSR